MIDEEKITADEALSWAKAYYNNLKLKASSVGIEAIQFNQYNMETKARKLFVSLAAKTTRQWLIDEALKDYNHIIGLLKTYHALINNKKTNKSKEEN